MAEVWLTLATLGLFMIRFGVIANTTKDDALEVMRAMLGENIMTTDIQQFKQENVNIVAFWMRAIDEDNPTMCTVDYIRTLGKQLMIIKEHCDIFNMDELHSIVLYRIIESCSDEVVDTFELLGPPNETLGIIGFIYNRWIYGPFNPSGTLRYLAEWMLKMVGYDKRNQRDEFIGAWKGGPCKMIIDSLEQRNMESVKNLINLIEESNVDPFSIEDFELRFDISVIQFCRYLQWEGALDRIWNALQDRDFELEQHVLDSENWIN